MKLLNKLSQWVSESTFEGLPSMAIEKSKECIKDVCGVTIAGSRHPSMNIIREYIEYHSVPGSCCLIGTKDLAGAPTAAFANAFAAHVWDFDDTCYAGIVHPSAILFPAVLALGEEVSASGKDILLAYIVGLEVQGRIGEAVSPHLFMKGWFTTSILGVIGAATASSKLLKLGTVEIKNAIGLALCQAGGMRQNNGTPAKPYTAGRASENGILSARMAQKGLSASPDILEGPEGFFHIYCDDQHNDIVFNQLGSPLVILSPGVYLKPYPTCSGTHAAMDAIISLVKENHLTWQQVKSVQCRTTPMAVRSLIYNNPVSSEQAQFSMPFCIACVLRNGKLDISDLTEENLHDRGIKELMGKVVMEPTETFGLTGKNSTEYPEGAEITLRTVDGRVLQKFVGHAKGSPANPFTKEEQRAKFCSCAKNIIDDHKVNLCLDTIEKLQFVDNVQILSQNMIP